jgi:hypothetical protein
VSATSTAIIRQNKGVVNYQILAKTSILRARRLDCGLD